VQSTSFFEFIKNITLTTFQFAYNVRVGVKGRKDILNQIDSIPGWFSIQDQLIFQLLLQVQQKNNLSGNLLEIGVYLGKSAVLLGANRGYNDEFIACDLFSGESSSINNNENLLAYSGLTRKRFEENYQEVIGELPRILNCSSLKLWKELPTEKFRFIHIDGSHLYNFVKSDLLFATNALVAKGGLIVLDDFRAQHTLGVSKALWEEIFEGRLQPLIFSAAKVYLVLPEDRIYCLEQIRELLKEVSLDSEFLDLFPSKSIRVKGLSDADLYNRNSKLTWWVPPIFLPKVRRFLSLLQMHLF